MTLSIHEFSTGIQAERTADGSWVSRGFSGQYMNKTIDPIPVAVQTAISNREFAVAEGASSEDPAMIGREVWDNAGGWSVVAVVTRGRDDRGRNPSVYRYFLCEGIGNLSKIVAWLLSQRSHFPVFNPFDTKVIGQPNFAPDTPSNTIPLQQFQEILTNPIPIIIPHNRPSTPLILDQIAQAVSNGQPIAWAYKVEALELPRSFLVIQPGSAKAEQLLQKTLASTPRTSRIVAGEQGIKSAVSGLISRDKVKPEQLQTLETALGNPQIDNNYWKSIFDSKGANQAKSQNIYSPQMVRLLTLQAMVIPDTLPEFLRWMAKRGKEDDHYQASAKFQGAVRKVLVQLGGQALLSRIYEGTKLIIPQLIDNPELLEPTAWLLKNHQGLWNYYYHKQLREEIDHDLKLMPNYARCQKQDFPFKLMDDPQWKTIFHDLQIHWKNDNYVHQKKYEPLAELFAELRDYKLAAFFYQIETGSVPEPLFYKLNKTKPKVYDIPVNKQIGVLEATTTVIVKLGGFIVPFVLVLPLMLISIILGVVIGKGFDNDDQANIKPTTTPSTSSISSVSSTVSPTPSPVVSLTPSPSSSAIPEYLSDTDEAVKNLISEIVKYTTVKDHQTVENTILSALQAGSGNRTLTINQVLTGEGVGKEAIKSYQEKVMEAEGEFADGVIDYNGQTYKVLKCHVGRLLEVKVTPVEKCKVLDKLIPTPTKPSVPPGI